MAKPHREREVCERKGASMWCINLIFGIFRLFGFDVKIMCVCSHFRRGYEMLRVVLDM